MLSNAVAVLAVGMTAYVIVRRKSDWVKRSGLFMWLAAIWLSTFVLITVASIVRSYVGVTG